LAGAFFLFLLSGEQPVGLRIVFFKDKDGDLIHVFMPIMAILIIAVPASDAIFIQDDAFVLDSP
jgi:hypothetical protein